MWKDDLLNRLHRLDEDAELLYADDRRFRLVIVGGGALVLMEVLSRSTLDIDAISASRELHGLLEKYDINCHVQTYVNNFPYNFEDRLTRLPIPGKKIDFYTASLEDIVIAKLFSYRDSDRRDIESDLVVRALDWTLLEHLAEDESEVKVNALNDRAYMDFRSNYEEYIRRCRPCES